MKYISLSENKTRRLSFYLAMEEFVAKHLNEDESFFMWQVNPTVIFGRNQLMQNEINFEYIKENNIEIYRRKSGGGCVYADFSNIMFSYIAKNTDVSFSFQTYLDRVSGVLQKLGVNAIASGRNDITIDEKKISGNAFYRTNGKSIVHGTMLFDTDLEKLVLSISPNNEKLISKGIESVRKRVTNLSEYLDIDIESFKDFMKKNLCNEEIVLSEKDIQKIEEIELEYLSEEFILGNNPRYTIVKKDYNEAGDIQIHLELKNNIIKDVNIIGDYFLIGDIGEGLIKKLIDQPYTKENISVLLNNINVAEIIHKLSNEKFMYILFKE